jgi:hypothetical protein
MAAPTTRPGAALFALLVHACAACQPAMDDPTPPDTRALLSQYDSPSGELSGTRLSALADTFFAHMQTVDDTDALASVHELLNRAAAVSGIAGTESGAIEEFRPSKLLVVAQATRLCGGPDFNAEAAAIADGGVSAGSIHMTLKGGRFGIFPVVWGHFDRCSEQIGDLDVSLDGNFSLTLVRRERGRDMLYSFDGEIAAPHPRHSGSLDFRLLANGTIELRVNGSDGDVIVSRNSQQQEYVRDRHGLWTCDLAQRRCTDPRSGAVLSTELEP